ncbi:hypothetical protein M3699_22095 [Peribacillus simplex]|uniref:hypothetical protein n=1 Tax=Peribacillus simplex TaxID=1478 RepID=UPI00203D8837|nr:hypothetical protein [Peribacillus simplex]MCM3676469.1 hypothetical protein [Peribacillus simplex]
MSVQAKSGYMSFGMEPITGRMNAGTLTGMTSRSWSGIRGDVNVERDLQKMSLNCLTSYPTFA